MGTTGTTCNTALGNRIKWTNFTPPYWTDFAPPLTGRLRFFSHHAPLADAQAFAAYLAPLRKTEWVVYSKRPFGEPQAVLAYLARYTHRVAIANSRLIAADKTGVTFKWKDYRIQGAGRYKTMTLPTHEFIRRFLMHVLPGGFHRIRHGACPWA